jgi:hypothetical protein
LVCQASWDDSAQTHCPQCGYDSAAGDARDPVRIQAARNAFRDRTSAYAPETRVTAADKRRPWLAVALGFLIFVVWLRACSSGGFRF